MTISRFQRGYRFLSNFYPVSINMHGATYRTVEHAFQAMKTLDIKERLAIRNAPTPSEAKRLGRHVTLRPDWNGVDVMRELVFQKFNTNPDLMRRLLETQDEELVEGNFWHDNYWGRCDCLRCVDKERHNVLGQLLMKTRTQLQEKNRERHNRRRSS